MTKFQSSREIPATPEHVFAAFSDPERHARWWGPAGFTNTFKEHEFKPGGRWLFTMHGPDGKNYPNESVFEEIIPAQKIVIHHIANPRYLLTIELSASTKGTLVTWTQVFENEQVAKGIQHIVAPANEQNLDKLTVEVTRAASK